MEQGSERIAIKVDVTHSSDSGEDLPMAPPPINVLCSSSGEKSMDDDALATRKPIQKTPTEVTSREGSNFRKRIGTVIILPTPIVQIGRRHSVIQDGADTRRPPPSTTKRGMTFATDPFKEVRTKRIEHSSSVYARKTKNSTSSLVQPPTASRLATTSSACMPSLEPRVKENENQVPRSASDSLGARPDDGLTFKQLQKRIAHDKKDRRQFGNITNDLAAKLRRTVKEFRRRELDQQGMKPHHPQSLKTKVHQPQISDKHHRHGMEKSPEQRLEDKFRQSTSLTPADILELVASTGLSRGQIRKWFRQRRNKDSKVVQMDSGLSPISRTVESPSVSANFVRRFDRRQDNARESRMKFIKEPSARIANVEMIRSGLDKIRNCPLQRFQSLLSTTWNTKASNLFNLFKGSTYSDKKTLMKESRRLADNFQEDLFSLEQRQAIDMWRMQFLDEQSKSVEEKAKNRDRLDQFIVPWLVPFFYSRTATQDGRYLTLEVALHDLTKLRHMSGAKWFTPTYMSYALL